MKDFNGPRKSGGFRGKSGFGDRGGFGKPPRGGGRDFERPMMHKAVCSDCGHDCEVPFRPNGAKPVLCSACFSVQKGGEGRGFGGRERDFSPRSGRSSERTMFRATCQECGSVCEVPFRPTEGKPIFCSDCFHGSDQSHKQSRSTDNGKDQFSSLNAKLDQIIALLKPLAPAAPKTVAKEEPMSKVDAAILSAPVKKEKKLAKPVKKEKVVAKAVVKKAKATKKK